jgi:lysophospholipase L1-like esterase
MPLLDTLVAPFNPKAVIIYIGANDIHALKKTAQETMDDLKVLLEAINEKLPESKLYYIPVYQTGAHPEFWVHDIELNRLVHEFAEGISYLQVVDVPSALLDSNNQVDNSVFRSDLLHLNDKGYAIWVAEARTALGLEAGGGLS